LLATTCEIAGTAEPSTQQPPLATIATATAADKTTGQEVQWRWQAAAAEEEEEQHSDDESVKAAKCHSGAAAVQGRMD